MTAGNISSSKQETSKTDYHVGTCQFLLHVEKTPFFKRPHDAMHAFILMLTYVI